MSYSAAYLVQENHLFQNMSLHSTGQERLDFYYGFLYNLLKECAELFV